MNSSLNEEESGPSIDYWQVIKNRYGIILLTFLMVFMTAAVLTWVIEKKYESTALVQVLSPDQNPNSIIGVRGAQLGPAMTRSFFQNQFLIIESPATLERVVEELGLEEDWGVNREEAIDRLKAITRAQDKRGSDLVEITVRHAEPETARRIADAVARSYKNGRRQQEKEDGERTLAILRGQLQDQQDLVAEKQSELASIARSLGVVIEQGQATDQDTGFRSIAAQESQLQAQKATIEARINTLLNLPPDQLIKVAAGMQLPENTVKQLYPQYTQAKVELGGLETSGYGPNHPKVRTQRQLIASMQEELTAAVGSLREILSTQLEQVRAELARVTQLKEQLKEKKIDDAIGYQEFENAKADAAVARQVQVEQELKVKAQEAALADLSDSITIYEQPKAGNRPVSPNVPLVFGIGAGLGLVLGVGLAFFLEYLDTSVKSLEDVERYLKVPVLAVIPRDVGVLHKQSGMSPDSEAYRILRTNIEFNRKNPEDNSITVVSGGAGEGKSTTLVNLAYICAQGGYTTLMIDADLRRPRLHTFFDINNSVGLTNYLTTELALEDVILQTPVDNLFFMPSGILPADAAGILNSRRMSELIQDVKQRFDLVLVDSPPILGVSDASVLASEVDLTMIVVQHGKLPRNMLVRVKQAVESVGGHVLGVVLNNVDVRSDSQYQYYTSYYTYYAPTSQDPQENLPVSTASLDAEEPKSSSSKADDLY